VGSVAVGGARLGAAVELDRGYAIRVFSARSSQWWNIQAL
jgi:hypothetical protein